MHIARRFHLTYCSNIHPGQTWDEVRANLQTYLPQVRKHMAFEGPFGIGLRLSGQAAQSLDQPDTLSQFKQFLKGGDYYVFTINGFPYGVFHGERVKEDVYLPDWLDEERLVYTNRLASILAELTPPDLSIPGSVSTSPGAFHTNVRSASDVKAMAARMLRHAAFLEDLERRTGKRVTLAIEAEPCCYMETIDDVIRFFEDFLFDPGLIRETSAGLSVEAVRQYIGVCFDACHMAVEFEDPKEALDRLGQAGIEIFKFQISSALRLNFRAGDGQPETKLRPFAESTYLHQVVENGSRGFLRYVDLPDALAAENESSGAGDAREWRVHFHVPLFLDRMKGFETSQDYLVSLLDLIRRDDLCPSLEVETYTWDVLPAEYRNVL